MLPLGLFVLFAAAVVWGDDDDGVTIGGDGDGTDPDTGDAGDGTDADPGETTVDEDALTALDLTLVTDPETGALTITAPEGETGSLIVVQDEAEQLVGPLCCSFDGSYTATVFWVPDGLDPGQILQDFDFNGFVQNSPNSAEPTAEDIFAGTGAEKIASFDLGRTLFSDQSTAGDADSINFLNTRVDLPEIQSNLPIEYFPSIFAGAEATPAGFTTTYETGLYFAFDEVSDEVFFSRDLPLGDFEVQDGEIIDGTEFSYLIASPYGDPTAVTVEAGAGEDTVFAGLNDTIITNDDTDADEIRIAEPVSFGKIFDEVPVLRAGAEDTVVVSGENNFAIRYEVDLGGGVTEVFYHVVTADAAPGVPSQILDQSGGRTIEEFYDEAGFQILATGSLGSFTTDANGAVTADNTVAAPQFDGLDQGLFAAKLPLGGRVFPAIPYATGWAALV